jgi:hypothetical protein
MIVHFIDSDLLFKTLGPLSCLPRDGGDVRGGSDFIGGNYARALRIGSHR